MAISLTGEGRDGLHSLVHTGAYHQVSNLELERVEMVCILHSLVHTGAYHQVQLNVVRFLS